MIFCIKYSNILGGRVGLAPVKAKEQLVSQMAREWLSDFIEKHSDSDKFHLPSCLTRRPVYQLYEKYCRETDRSTPLSESHFYKVWQEEFSHVTIPKVYIT